MMPALIIFFTAQSLPLKAQSVLVQSAKIIARILFVFLSLYLVFWLSVAAYFSYAQHDKGVLESMLGRFFDRPVDIQSFAYEWNNFSPRFQINGLRVQGDSVAQPALSVESLSAELSGLSLLRFWPQFKEFAMQRPQLEIVSLAGGDLQVAGIKLNRQRNNKADPKRLISWLTEQLGASWVDGQVSWRRLDGSVQRYHGLALVYQRQDQQRDLKAHVMTPEGALAFRSKEQGDPLSASDWSASFEVIGNQNQRLLAPEDLSLQIRNGQGRLRLKTLDIQRISDFIQLVGLADKARWLLNAQLFGRLHDVDFSFSGPLLQFTDWSLNASASDIGFKSLGQAPAIDNLTGKLSASNTRGQFLFSAENATFKWARWYGTSFPIDRAKGNFNWYIEPNGDVFIALNDGEFKDKNTQIKNVDVSVKLDRATQTIDNIGQLFKVKSVADLRYQDGVIVQDIARGLAKSTPSSINPLVVDASADYDIKEIKALSDYLPTHRLTKLFKTWWTNAFISGSASQGTISYKGELSTNAIKIGKAELKSRAKFDDVTLDYGYLQGWPRINNSRGIVTLSNDLFQVFPEQAWLGPDKIKTADVKLTSLFSLDRQVEVEGEVTTQLATFLDFLFKGPLVKRENWPDTLPVEAAGGSITTQLKLMLPLRNVNNVRVSGTAQVNDAGLRLPGGVPVDRIQADVTYTERSVESANIRAQYLGHPAKATLTTLEEAQPPKLMLSAQGEAQISAFEPWIGEHISSLFSGQGQYQSELLIDGPRLEVKTNMDLVGVAINTPAPLGKTAEQQRDFNLSMVLGSGSVKPSLSINYGDSFSAQFAADQPSRNAGLNLFDRSLIRVGQSPGKQEEVLDEGINLAIVDDNINLDEWLSVITDLAKFKPNKPSDNTAFLDAMRSVTVSAQNPFLFNRDFGPFEFKALSVDGRNWIGSADGEHIEGTFHAQPRNSVSAYQFNLRRLNVIEGEENARVLAEIDHAAKPTAYPAIDLVIDDFRLDSKPFGKLVLSGQPENDTWKLNELKLEHNGVKTTVNGQWVNSPGTGTISSFDFETQIKEAGVALDDMEFDVFVNKGRGSIKGNLNWIGAPHEFDYSRLNGDFDINIRDGELVNINAGSGKLIGLLNFNAIARRLVFDFSDVFASGLEFDTMIYSGVLADGQAIMNEAFILSPAVFVRMEGKVDLKKELVDMDIHVSPELGGNIALLSAIANPAAGAVVYLTQRIFKDQLRNARFRSYRALGTWEDFELTDAGSGKALTKKQPDDEDKNKDSQTNINVGTKPASKVKPEPQLTDSRIRQTP